MVLKHFLISSRKIRWHDYSLCIPRNPGDYWWKIDKVVFISNFYKKDGESKPAFLFDCQPNDPIPKIEWAFLHEDFSSEDRKIWIMNGQVCKGREAINGLIPWLLSRKNTKETQNG